MDNIFNFCNVFFWVLDFSTQVQSEGLATFKAVTHSVLSHKLKNSLRIPGFFEDNVHLQLRCLPTR